MGSRFSLALGVLAVIAAPASLLGQQTPVQSDRWNRTALRWVGLLESGEFDAAGAMVDAAVPAGAMTASRLEMVWAQLTSQLGSLRTVAPGIVSEQAVYHVVDLPAGFTSQNVILRVVLTDSLQVSGFFVRPSEPPAYEAPPYVDTTSFQEVAVTVGRDPWTLPGVLSVPDGDGPFPGIVLVHGSGPNDRDETIGGSRPFRDLAWGLASRGIVVLRYDKRTKVYPLIFPPDAGLDEEVMDDAVAALHLLRSRPEVGQDESFLLGHSLGGMLASDIALRDGSVRGVIILAAPARPILDVLQSQVEYLGSLPGTHDFGGRAQMDSVLGAIDRFQAGGMAPDDLLLGVRGSYWTELQEVDPVASARNLAVPVLVLQGGRDYQSTPQDLSLWESGLAGKDGFSAKLYPSLNHLFAPGEGKATPEEYATEVQHVDGDIVRDLSEWIQRVLGQAR